MIAFPHPFGFAVSAMDIRSRTPSQPIHLVFTIAFILLTLSSWRATAGDVSSFGVVKNRYYLQTSTNAFHSLAPRVVWNASPRSNHCNRSRTGSPPVRRVLK